MTHQLFDDLVGSLPPSTVDVERIVAGIDRTRRWRRAVLAGGAAAVLAAGALVVTHREPPPAGYVTLERESPEVTAVRNLGDVRRFVEREIATAVPGLQWTGDWDSETQVQLNGPLRTERAFVFAGRAGRLSVQTRWFMGGDLCTNEPNCAPVPLRMSGVSCVSAEDLAVRCDHAASRGDVAIVIGDLGTTPAFDVHLLVPMTARLAFLIRGQ